MTFTPHTMRISDKFTPRGNGAKIDHKFIHPSACFVVRDDDLSDAEKVERLMDLIRYQSMKFAQSELNARYWREEAQVKRQVPSPLEQVDYDGMVNRVR